MAESYESGTLRSTGLLTSSCRCAVLSFLTFLSPTLIQGAHFELPQTSPDDRSFCANDNGLVDFNRVDDLTAMLSTTTPTGGVGMNCRQCGLTLLPPLPLSPQDSASGRTTPFEDVDSDDDDDETTPNPTTPTRNVAR